MTPRQLSAIDAIRDLMREKRIAPTMQEIANRMGVSKVTVFGYVRRLEAEGHIKIVSMHRGIRLVNEKCTCCGK